MISLDDFDSSGNVDLTPIYKTLNILNNNVSDLSSSISAIEGNTSSIWDYVSTLSGGGGDYLESWSVHSDLGYMYNVNDYITSQVWTANVFSASPAMNWASNTAESKDIALKITGIQFNNNVIRNISGLIDLNFDTLSSNYISLNTVVELDGKSLQQNRIENNYVLDLKYSSVLSENSIYNMNYYREVGNNAYSNEYIGHNFHLINAREMKSNSFTREYHLDAHCQEMNQNTFSNCSWINIDGYKLRLNQFVGSDNSRCLINMDDGYANTFESVYNLNVNNGKQSYCSFNSNVLVFENVNYGDNCNYGRNSSLKLMGGTFSANTFGNNTFIEGDCLSILKNTFNFSNKTGLAKYDLVCSEFNSNSMNKLTHCVCNIDALKLSENTFNCFDTVNITANSMYKCLFTEDDQGI